MPSALPLTAINAFTAAARAGSLTAAAATLHVTHSAVSHQIKGLETWLGCKLFVRHTSGVTLTEQGRRLQATTSRALSDIEHACASLRGSSSTRAFTLGCPGTFMLQWLIPRLESLERACPDLVLNVVGTSDLGRLRAGHIDALLYFGHERFSGEISDYALADNDIGPICAPSLASDSDSAEKIMMHPLLATESYRSAWRLWANANAIDPARLAVTRSFDHLSHLIRAAENAMGVGIVPSLLVQDELAQGRLCAPMGFVNSGDRIALLSLLHRENEDAVNRLAPHLSELLHTSQFSKRTTL